MEEHHVKKKEVLFRILSTILEREKRRGEKERLFKRIMTIYKECKQLKFCQLARHPPASRPLNWLFP